MKSFTLFFLLCACGTGALRAQCTDGLVRDQLDVLTTDLSEAGYATTYLTRCDDLPAGYSRYHDVQVYAGVQYNLLAVTDGNARGATVEVFDRKGELLASDTAYGTAPKLDFTPRRSHNVRVKVTLADCKRKSCYYGLRLQAE